MRKSKIFSKLATFILIILFVIGVAIALASYNLSKTILSKPVSIDQWNSMPEGYNSDLFKERLKQFNLNTSYQALSDMPSTDNNAYSPTSMFMALGILSECANDQTKEQIITAMNMNGVSDLNDNIDYLFQRMSYDQVKLSNSIWLKADLTPDKDMMSRLSTKHHSYVFSKDLLSADTQKSINEWIEENTNGLVKRDVSVEDIDPQVVSIILNTIYFKSGWRDQFDRYYTKEKDFYTGTGETVLCDVMYKNEEAHTYIQTDRYLSSYLDFTIGYRMHFILPSEGVSTNDILSNYDEVSVAIRSHNREYGETAKVHFDVPKFSFKSNVDCEKILDSIGLSDISRGGSGGDFSPLGTDEMAFISRIAQSTAISVDEDGVEAGTYTEVELSDSCAEPEAEKEIYLTLNRPFIFVISSYQDEILFVGVVNNPLS